MRIGVPKEIKTHEYRVGLTPASVRELVHRGHEVLVEAGAGSGIGCPDGTYRMAGARVVDTAAEAFAANLVVKVKEPQPIEYSLLHPDLVLFTYLHLAPDTQQAEALISSGATALAYETVTGPGGQLPLLAPMSEVAGRMSIQVGAHCLEKEQGGIGILLGGVPGVPPGKITIIGGGVVGTSAARVAAGMGARATVLDSSLARLAHIDEVFKGLVQTVHANLHSVEHHVVEADLVIGAVLIPGATTPRIVSREMMAGMRKGSVMVDVSIDQGGCFETSRPTSHAEPTYVEDGIVHYCVTNMPGAVARTSAFALNNATLPMVLALADKGWFTALSQDHHLRAGLNIHRGRVTHPAVAQSLGVAYVAPEIF